MKPQRSSFGLLVKLHHQCLKVKPLSIAFELTHIECGQKGKTPQCSKKNKENIFTFYFWSDFKS